jgi:polyisoprenoid-binding protein YceI
VGIVRAASIDTDEPSRDAHLRSAEFLDAEHFPEARFASRQVVPLGGPTFRVVGDLTLKDVTREVALEATVEGSERDPWGNERVGIRVRGEIDRKDFGLRWQQMLQTGGLMVGEQVRIVIDISAVRAA